MRNAVLLPTLAVALLGCSSDPSLSAPSSLTAAPLGGGVHLTWKDNSSDETAFEIQRLVEGASYAQLATVPFNIAQFHDEPVTAGLTYSYRVRALGNGPASDYSNEAVIRLGASAGTDGGEIPDGGTGDGGPSAVSFRRDVVPILQQSCGATTMGCHARDAYAATKGMGCRGWLSLEDAALGARFYSGAMTGQATGCPDRTLYERLTQLDAWMCDGPRKRYIAPGSLLGSQVYQAAVGDPSGGGTCNKQPGVALGRMPPPPAQPLGAAAAKKLETWIKDGAPNN